MEAFEENFSVLETASTIDDDSSSVSQDIGEEFPLQSRFFLDQNLFSTKKAVKTVQDFLQTVVKEFGAEMYREKSDGDQMEKLKKFLEENDPNKAVRNPPDSFDKLRVKTQPIPSLFSMNIKPPYKTEENSRMQSQKQEANHKPMMQPVFLNNERKGGRKKSVDEASDKKSTDEGMKPPQQFKMQPVFLSGTKNKPPDASKKNQMNTKSDLNEPTDYVQASQPFKMQPVFLSGTKNKPSTASKKNQMDTKLDLNVPADNMRLGPQPGGPTNKTQKLINSINVFANELNKCQKLNNNDKMIVHNHLTDLKLKIENALQFLAQGNVDLTTVVSVYPVGTRVNCQFCNVVVKDMKELSQHVLHSCSVVISQSYDENTMNYSYLQLLTDDKLKCTLCNYNCTELVQLLQHSESGKHKINDTKQKLRATTDLDNNPVSDTNFIYCCGCKVFIPDNKTQYDKHMYSYQHENSKTNPVTATFVYRKGEMCYCNVCDTTFEFDITSIKQHIGENKHVSKLKTLRKATSMDIFCKICGQNSNDLAAFLKHIDSSAHTLCNISQNTSDDFEDAQICCVFCDAKCYNLQDLCMHQKLSCQHVVKEPQNNILDPVIQNTSSLNIHNLSSVGQNINAAKAVSSNHSTNKFDDFINFQPEDKNISSQLFAVKVMDLPQLADIENILKNLLEKLTEIKDVQLVDSNTAVVKFYQKDSMAKILRMKNLIRIDGQRMNIIELEMKKEFELDPSITLSDSLKTYWGDGADVDQIGKQLAEMCDELKFKAFEEVARHCSLILSHNKYKIHGSHLNNLAFLDSTLDIYFDVGVDTNMFSTADQIDLMLLNERIIRDCDQLEITEINTSSHVPFIRVTYKDSKVDCKFSFKNALVYHNTKLIGFLVKFNPVVKPVLLYLKFWFNEHHKMLPGLSQYGMKWLILFYLQQKGVIPVISWKNNNTNVNTINGWPTQLEISKSQMVSDTFTVKDLVLDFFNYYSQFNFDQNVICVPLGKCVPRSEVKQELINRGANFLNNSFEQEFNEKRHICLMDPYELDNNITRDVDGTQLRKFITLCILTSKLFVQK